MVLPQLVDANSLYGIYSGFELFAFVVALITGYYSYKIYKISSEVKYSHLSFSFLLLAAALLVRGVLDFATFEFIRSSGLEAFKTTIASGNSPLYSAGTDLYRLLALAGYAFLIKTMYKADDLNKSGLLVLAIIAGVLGSKFFSFMTFNIASLALLALIIRFSYNNYSSKKSLNAKLTLSAFALLALGELLFIAIIINPQFYLVAHLARLAGFAVLAYNLYLVFRK